MQRPGLHGSDPAGERRLIFGIRHVRQRPKPGCGKECTRFGTPKWASTANPPPSVPPTVEDRRIPRLGAYERRQRQGEKADALRPTHHALRVSLRNAKRRTPYGLPATPYARCPKPDESTESPSAQSAAVLGRLKGLRRRPWPAAVRCGFGAVTTVQKGLAFRSAQLSQPTSPSPRRCRKLSTLHVLIGDIPKIICAKADRKKESSPAPCRQIRRCQYGCKSQSKESKQPRPPPERVPPIPGRVVSETRCGNPFVDRYRHEQSR